MPGRFELYDDAAGNFGSGSRPVEGRSSPRSRGTSPAPALKGVESMRRNAGNAALDDQSS